MNIIQQQDNLKSLPDQVLQKELLQPTGAAPSYLVLSELQRRKQMRDTYAAKKDQPQTSMAEEFAMGMGGAQVGNYPQAVRQAQATPMTPETPMLPGPAMGPQGGTTPMGDERGQSPVQTQGFAGGGRVEMAPGAEMAPKGSDPVYWTDIVSGKKKDALGLGVFAGPLMAPITNIANGGSFMDVMKSMSPAATALNAMGVKFADGGPVEDPGWTWPSSAAQARERFRRAMATQAGGYNWIPQGVDSGPVPEPTPYPRRHPFMPGDPKTGALPPEIKTAEPLVPIQNWDVFQPAQGKSLGQTWSDSISGRQVGPRTGGGVQDYEPRVKATGLEQAPIPPSITTGGPNPLSSFPTPEEVFQPEGQPPLQEPPSGQPPGAGAPPSRNGGTPPGGATGGRSAGAGGVGGALNIGGPGLTDYFDQVQSLRGPDRFAKLEDQNRADLEKIRGGMEGERGMALLSAGLGILGGDSPFAAVNIGRGAQAGIKQWNDASKEIRLAERDIRNASTQIAIARATRDDKLLESGITLYARGEQSRQQGLDRQNQLAVAAAGRQQALEFKKMELDESAKDRQMRREQHEIDSYRNSYLKIQDGINHLSPKITAASMQALAGEAGAKEALDKMKQELQVLEQQRAAALGLYNNSLLERTARTNNAQLIRSKEEYDALAPGTTYLDASTGTIAIKKKAK